jgi:hypothetical protein
MVQFGAFWEASPGATATVMSPGWWRAIANGSVGGRCPRPGVELNRTRTGLLASGGRH